jgi:hypothetical protein
MYSCLPQTNVITPATLSLSLPPLRFDFRYHELVSPLQHLTQELTAEADRADATFRALDDAFEEGSCRHEAALRDALGLLFNHHASASTTTTISRTTSMMAKEERLEACGFTLTAAILSAPALCHLPPLFHQLGVGASMLSEESVEAIRKALIGRITSKWSKDLAFQVADCAALAELGGFVNDEVSRSFIIRLNPNT